MAGIFLSYRRYDAEGQAGRLYDDLVEHFGPDSVFMDVAGIEAGRDFRQAIDHHVTSCGVLLALIGREWVSATDSQGRRRLDDPNDFVRLEVATALKRDIPVVPVLVHGAAMPQPAALPPDCADLCYRNAVELTHARWASDVQVLIKALTPSVDARPAPAQKESTLAAPASGNASPAGHTPAKSTGAKPWLIGLPLVLAIAGGGVVAYRDNDADGPKPQRKGEIALSEWIAIGQLQAYRQARPPGERFPYGIELQCARKGESQIRARFGPPPPGVQEVRIGHFLFRGKPELPVVEGFREYSISQCDLPKDGRLIVRVMVRP